MANLDTWVSAARLRTLPLSISGILVGSSIAVAQNEFNSVIFALALATTLGLQILSNFANDYGDFVKGTDNEDRVGPQRALQSGMITRDEMFWGMIVTGIITFFFAVTLIYLAFGTRSLFYGLVFLVLGIGAIAAAVKYTVGDSAYGYRGLGDVFVFVFFGLVAVYGSYFLYTMEWDWRVFLPAATIGFLSAGVLNLNNMRDRAADAKAGKNTLVVKLGEAQAKQYHYFLLLAAFSSMILYSAFSFTGIDDLLYLFAFVPLLFHLKRIMENKNPVLLDPELKKLALGTFLLAVLFGLGQIL
ncbi:1,4-dihydroxy-2-naphthoate octaprenyltransferase [Salinimicrobium sp. MT39]|jgi:1,4-dihydroxy-2-naphthoate octaprenyltransferase|uniref:1,4-dihydroxy-2-naphthoate octaprenyltransferase n=1 Tax=Salinimicrobium profundisediminis TaxID=2994553 RepID=A0A9X3D276_9FLAO|nr:1,4-dihydroxy-2-naphthoate octaprenyltransferase [Salinimicrobium profundisediminis]MCX2839565.1 1,4-dihydroxy-2-naphthoate octaprenyltransferase [Salinimicrobium profundisediminis]